MAVRLADLPTFRAPRNIVLDARTVAAMVRIFCRDVHGRPAGHLCEACAALLEYAEQRLARCPFGSEKTTCRECPIHCYRPAQRSAMKDVMRYAGPRMLCRHPWLTVRHLWLDRKGPPPWPPHKTRDRPSASRLREAQPVPIAPTRVSSQSCGVFPTQAARSPLPRGKLDRRRDQAGQGNCSPM